MASDRIAGQIAAALSPAGSETRGMGGGMRDQAADVRIAAKCEATGPVGWLVLPIARKIAGGLSSDDGDMSFGASHALFTQISPMAES
jgi:hypothetical protein